MRALFESAVQMMRRGEEGLLAVQDEWAGGHEWGGAEWPLSCSRIHFGIHSIHSKFDLKRIVECLRQRKIATTTCGRLCLGQNKKKE